MPQTWRRFKKTMTRINYFLGLALAAAFLSGCASDGPTPINSSALPPLPMSAPVYVYLFEKDVNAPFKVVSIVSYRNASKNQGLTFADAVPILKMEARKAGANGLIILDADKIRSGIVSGNRIKARAILLDQK
jgi:hypothetical protein